MLRRFLLAILSMTLLGPAVTAEAAARQIKKQAPGFYRMMLGDLEITVLSDGTAPRDVDKIMSKPEQIRRSLTRNHQSLPIEISINAFLINTGAKLILIDTGAGELFSPHSGGRLVANLRAAEYQPEQIDAVLLTHIHADHSGGLSIGGQRVFPNALVYVDKHDSEFWLSAAAEATAPADKRILQQSHATIDAYVSAGKLHPFDGPTELFPGIRALPAPGHTPGHTAYMVESRGQRLLLWGDIVHVAEVQFADPDITIEYDVDRKAAVASRKKLLADAAEQGYLIGGAHISFPGLGHVCADTEGYSWIPVPYSAGQ